MASGYRKTFGQIHPKQKAFTELVKAFCLWERQPCGRLFKARGCGMPHADKNQPICGRLAAATDWPTRRIFSSGR